MPKLTNPNDVVWIEKPIIKMHDNPPAASQWEYKVIMPDWLAEWDVYGDWEVERFDSMRDNLKQGDVLFDIGTEIGWQSIIYAKFVGPENMVLIEPASTLWPNIKHTWFKNFSVEPKACYYGLFSNKTTSEFCLPQGLFPAEAEGELVDAVTYRYIHEHGWQLPQIRIDDYVALTGNVPDALTMDVEGAELLILQGAVENLKKYNLKVWVSVHPELSLRDYNYSAKQLHKFMASLGYKGKHLATDHEEHWYFTKVKA